MSVLLQTQFKKKNQQQDFFFNLTCYTKQILKISGSYPSKIFFSGLMNLNDPKDASGYQYQAREFIFTCGTVSRKEKIHLNEIIPGPQETGPEIEALKVVSFSINFRNCHHVECKSIHGQIRHKDSNSRMQRLQYYFVIGIYQPRFHSVSFPAFILKKHSLTAQVFPCSEHP